MTSSIAPQNPAPAPVPLVTGPPPEPYRGIAAFRFADAQILLGRASETEQLVQLTTVYRGVLLFGESGVGKSSMVNAGFIPQALGFGYHLERIRVRAQEGAELLVERITTDSAGEAELPSVLMEGRARSPDGDPMSIAELRERLGRLGPDRRTVLIFDQFEEFISLFEDAPAPEQLEGTRKIQEKLLDLFADLHHDARLPIKLLFSFREDYLGKLEPLLRRLPALADHFVRLAPLRSPALRTIVEGPLKKFPQSYGNRLKPESVERIIREFTDRVGAGEVNLSEVQIVCRLLWEDPALDGLLAEKGVSGLLDRFLDNALHLFSSTEQTALRHLLSYMVTPGGVRDIVSLDVLLERVGEYTTLSRDQLTQLLAAVDGGQTRLVRSERRDLVLYYTILSEFLIRWIKQWRVDFAKEKEHRELEAKYEVERRRRRRNLTIATALFLVLAIVGAQAFTTWRYRSLNGEIAASKDLVDKANHDLQNSLTIASKRADSANARAAALDQTLALKQGSIQANFDSIQRVLSQAAEQKNATLQQQLETERSARLALGRLLQSAQHLAAVSDSSRYASADALTAAKKELVLTRQRYQTATSESGSISQQIQKIASEISEPSIREQVMRLAGQLPGAPTVQPVRQDKKGY